MLAMRQKHENEANAFKASDTKEQELMLKTHEKELEKLLARQAHELDGLIKLDTAEEKKFVKGLKERLSSDLLSFHEQKKKERKLHKEEVRTQLVSSGATKDAIKQQLKELKEQELDKIAHVVEEHAKLNEVSGGEELKSHKIQKIAIRHVVIVRQLEEVSSFSDWPRVVCSEPECLL